MKHLTLLILSFLLLTAHAQNIHPLGNLSPAHMDSFTYAVIGDFGDNSNGELITANMVKGWNPAFIVTTGDNDYEDKNGKDIETNISKYYASYINADLKKNRFFPCLGNHDQDTAEKPQILHDYFKLFPFLGSAADYDFTYGPVHFYSINSGPGGLYGSIDQAILSELKKKSNSDKDPFHLMFFHHPQYSTAYGASRPIEDHLSGYDLDAVLNGHIHYYERLTDTVRHIEYITIGCSGREDSKCPEPGKNKLANNKDFICGPCMDHQNGALKVTVVKLRTKGKPDKWKMTFEYYNVATPSVAADKLTLIK